MKIYDDIIKIFEDGIFGPTDIVIIWGKRRRGKSSLAGMFMDQFMRPKIAKNDVQTSKAICNQIREAGYNIHPPTDHTVFCDTFFESKGFGRKRNSPYKFNGIDFGLPNETHNTELLCPCGRYFLDETQDLFDSHRPSLSTFVTKSIELSGQMKIFLCLIAQRPKRIHIDIRELAVFIEVVKMKKVYNKYGRIIECFWECNIIYENADLEQYLNTHDRKYIDKRVMFKYKGNIFNCYDTNYFLPMFFRNMENRDLILEKTKRTEFSTSFFDEYFKNRVIDIPDSYFGKKPKSPKKEEVLSAD